MTQLFQHERCGCVGVGIVRGPFIKTLAYQMSTHGFSMNDSPTRLESLVDLIVRKIWKFLLVRENVPRLIKWLRSESLSSQPQTMEERMYLDSGNIRSYSTLKILRMRRELCPPVTHTYRLALWPQAPHILIPTERS